jgi:D-2-hydroxyacid dehydrogenase (NADP+)
VELHTCLWNDVRAFDFNDVDFDILRRALPGLTLVVHANESSFLEHAEKVEAVLTWTFKAAWYHQFASLKWIMTPAAGKELVEPHPSGKVKIVHGTFHGKLLSESLLSALLFMNHRMPQMLDNFQQHAWNRDIQGPSRLLSDQTVMIIGFGHIGQHCAKVLRHLGTRVIGISRSAKPVSFEAEVYGLELLADYLPEADHVVLLLPGGKETDQFMDETRLAICKKGAYLYNFGRGNALHSKDLVKCWEHLGGAFLDVTDEEPLPATSELWSLKNMMITPHSSCIYKSYKEAFLKETLDYLR